MKTNTIAQIEFFYIYFFFIYVYERANEYKCDIYKYIFFLLYMRAYNTRAYYVLGTTYKLKKKIKCSID